MNNSLLTEEEIKIWHMWKKTFKSIYGRIEKDSIENTGLSEGDFIILDRLMCLGGGTLRQHELSEAVEWTKSRLSHHLTRMEKRGLVIRAPFNNKTGVEVSITDVGKMTLENAYPIIYKGVKKYFIEQLTEQDIESITKLANRVNEYFITR
ncbi:DNA-binding MarR family transcriptional regulator [Mobilisporobacter senegalensis]|uniref:DNA-binding MarR family transcriptional regulator n=1 Tax=Mobilisporobacter senegalensis TaxID=1329262 RepID=A0A3N1XN03_9FIRM|nr:MarR family winged helix-turn-helix transcriptional regulator [Mobilisporobacter senegalensis]ROR28075.1 DNA-binding MarR family transcriptional regulator [Mobilisporobacter senegalensis]